MGVIGDACTQCLKLPASAVALLLGNGQPRIDGELPAWTDAQRRAPPLRGWQKGLLGAAATQMLRLIGPRRTLLQLDRAFATTDNSSKSTTEFVRETRALVRVHDPNAFPNSWVGIMQAGVEMLGVDGTVTLEPSSTPHEVVMRVKWT